MVYNPPPVMYHGCVIRSRISRKKLSARINFSSAAFSLCEKKHKKFGLLNTRLCGISRGLLLMGLSFFIIQNVLVLKFAQGQK